MNRSPNIKSLTSFALLSVVYTTSLAQVPQWPDPVAEHVIPAPKLGLVQGPMLGRPSATSIRVWVRTENPVEFEIRYATQLPLDADSPSVKGRTEASRGNTGIVDNDGKVRIRLGPADEGYGLVVYDVDGQFRATLTDAPLGAVSQLRKDGGSIKMMTMQEGCGITIRDQDGKPRVLMLQHEEGPQIVLKDAEGKSVFSAP